MVRERVRVSVGLEEQVQWVGDQPYHVPSLLLPSITTNRSKRGENAVRGDREEGENEIPAPMLPSVPLLVCDITLK